MRIVCISDTHEFHRVLGGFLPDGDVLVHAGDFTMQGEPAYVREFDRWLGTLPYKHKVVIPGNHELTFDPRTRGNTLSNAAKMFRMITNATILNDEQLTIEGVKFWGSPITPTFFNWAFMRDRGPAIQLHWDIIPDDTDVLITHGPPHGILDTASNRHGHVGCEELAKVVARVRPKLHVFGHIHGGHGQHVQDGTIFVNASICNERYQPMNLPRVVDVA